MSLLDTSLAEDLAAHDRLAAEAARGLAGCDVIALAPFSLARMPVLTTPGRAVGNPRRMLGR